MSTILEPMRKRLRKKPMETESSMLDTEVFLADDIVTICKHFADRVIDTNKDEYARRNQINYDKIKQDILVGKLAEWGVFFIYLNRNRNSVSMPDMNIYSAKDKSFDADLHWNLYSIHVKSQTFESFCRYGDSWMFQSKDPLFAHSSEYDIIVGCRVTVVEEGCLVEIRLEKPFKNIVFAEPKLSKFAGNKKAIYLKDNNE